MMFKVRPETAEQLGITKTRYRFADGNYLALGSDFANIEREWLVNPQEAAERHGAVCLLDYQVRDEQQGRAYFPMPGSAVQDDDENPDTDDIRDTDEAADTDESAEEGAGEV